jgi:prepilin-type N-terminal cleavage/methylation domain-containing protein
VRLRSPAALRDERGFTLIEILVVVIVIAILSAIAVSSYRGYQNRAHDAAAQEKVHQVVPAVHAYFVDHDSYAGMTIAGLRSSYDTAIDPAEYSLGTAPPTDSTYCIQSSSEDRTWRKNGPTAALEPQACP